MLAGHSKLDRQQMGGQSLRVGGARRLFVCVPKVISLEPPEEELWQGLSKTARNLVRRADKAGYRVTRVNWEASLDAYYDVHVETYARTGVPPHPKSYFGGIARYMAPSGASRLYALMSPAGEPAAFHNTIQLGAGANYHTGCSRTAVQADSAGYLLMWEALKAAKVDGAAWYDCGWIFPGARDSKQKRPHAVQDPVRR